MTFRDPSRPYVPSFANPRQAMQDLRECHEWWTRELETATGKRSWIIGEERKRLARISAELKAQY